MPLVHHQQCFGCGRTNLFGLMLEIERAEDGSVAGRCFIKQDHRGAVPGYAHDGIVGTALGEAMSLACGPETLAQAVTVGYIGAAAVGEFLYVEAQVEKDADGIVTATAKATSSAGAGGDVVAKARGTYSSAGG
ncbi:MAG: PaaI family thioesterase [Solirubrobacteraceae bacterium]